MPNVLYTPQQAARSALAALRYLSVLPRTVRQDFSKEFVAGVGQTVNVLGPVTAGKANTYTKANREKRDSIQINELGQKWIPVTMDDQPYNAVRLPDDFATFTIKQLETDVLKPQAESVVDGLVLPLLTVMQSVTNANGTNNQGRKEEPIPSVLPDGSNIRKVLVAARQVLNDRRVPGADRFVAVGSGIEAAILNDELLQKASEAGTDGLLREATIGRIFGFTILADPTLPSDFAVAYQRDAFAHVTRPSRKPDGAAKSATVAQDGFALRWIQHYNPEKLEDQSVVDTFVGATVLDKWRAVSFKLAAKSPVPTVAVASGASGRA